MPPDTDADKFTPRKLQTKHFSPLYTVQPNTPQRRPCPLASHLEPNERRATSGPEDIHPHFGYLQSRYTQESERASRDSKAEGCSSVRAVVVGALIVGVVAVVVIVVIILGIRVVIVLVAVAVVGSRR